MKKTRAVKAFHAIHLAWYAKHPATAPRGPEYMIGMYVPGDGCRFEFGLRHHDGIGWRVEMFDDSWEALRLPSFAPLLRRLGRVKRSDVDDAWILKTLIACGFRDLTEYVNGAA